MKHKGITFKLGLAITVIILLVLIPLGYVINHVLQNYFFAKAYEDLSLQCRRLVDIITNDELNATSMVVNTLKITNNHVMLLDGSGKTVVQSNPEEHVHEMISKEDWRALQSGSFIKKQITNTRPNYILVGQPIIYNGKFSGSILILSSTERIAESIAQVRKFVGLSVLGAILLALAFTIVVVRRLSNPLIEMEKATRRIARGDLSVKVAETSKDEFGSLARAINDLAADLKRFQDSRSEFFSSISHELRTPLTYIEGYVQLLNTETGQDKEQRKQIVHIISSETKRLKGLVNDLFDLAKLEEGKFELTLEWIDLTEVIDNAIGYVKLRAENKGIQIIFQDENIPLLYLDGNRMQQVFINLLDNGIRYTKDGSITITLTNEETFLQIHISDTGIGIPEEELPLIFDRFHRVEKSRSREHGGTGLGLAIVKRLVELQGGTIGVTSKTGEGTTFTMKFPIS